MEYGISAQISRAVQAVGRKNVGSQPTSTATSNAQTTAMGWAKSNASATSSNFAMPVKPRRTIHPGNMAGYSYARGTLLMAHETGYMNPIYQTARYSRRPLPVDRMIRSGLNVRSIIKSSIMDHTYRSAYKSSASMLSKFL